MSGVDPSETDVTKVTRLTATREKINPIHPVLTSALSAAGRTLDVVLCDVDVDGDGGDDVDGDDDDGLLNPFSVSTVPVPDMSNAVAGCSLALACAH